MHISQSTLQRIQSVTIEDIASDLDIDIRNHKCRCPFHDDHHPSMKFYASSNSAHCFVCGKSWDGIAMVRDLKNLDFTDACRWIADCKNIWIDDDKQHRKPMKATIQRKASPKPFTPKTSNNIDSNYVTSKLSTDNAFCRSLVTCGILSEEQMKRAAQRYRLGTSKDGGVIFWQIDQQQRVRDGKIMYYHDDCHRDHQHDPNWVCSLLSKAGRLPKDYRSVKCLFGLHLITLLSAEEDAIIAIVESEKTAVICSELMPSINPQPIIWLATGGLTCLNIYLLAPLTGYRVMIFPDTDLEGKAFKLWSDKAAEASQTLRHPFPVSNILELHASQDQKARKIDIADFIIEGNT